MFKTKLFRATILAIAALACSFSSVSASAATLEKSFYALNTSGTPVVFQLDSAWSVEQVAGQILVTMPNQSTYPYQDPTGALFVKVLNMPGFAAKYHHISGTGLYMNVQAPVQILCYSGQTTFTYVGTGYMKSFADGCSNFNLIKANSNQ